MDISAILTRQHLVLARLHALAENPPQSLVLEGGTEEERKTVALWWAALLNCKSSAQTPCLSCTQCRQIFDNTFSDLIIMDEAYYQEGRSHLSVDAVRAIIPVWGQAPTGEGYRVTIFPKITDLSNSVSNTLLKSFEEPRPGNVFVLLSPQRERLLPTLISRSWVMTLAWPESAESTPEAIELAKALVGFWANRQSWFEQTQEKIPVALALGMVNYLMGQVRDAMTGKTATSTIANGEVATDDVTTGDVTTGDIATGEVATGKVITGKASAGKVATELAQIFDAKGLRQVDLALTQAQEALSLSPSPVNPALVLDWVASAVKY